MSILSKSFLPAMDFVLARFPQRLRQKLVGSNQHLTDLLADLLKHGGKAALLEHARALGYRGKWTRDEPDRGEDGSGLARALGEFWLRVKERQKTVSPAYLPTPTWASILDTEWGKARGWLEAGNFSAFDEFLRNFFRNGGISGLWGADRMFQNFRAASYWDDLERLALFIRQFEAWGREVPGGSLDDLDEGRVGNPWGYDISGRLLVEPVFEYHAHALRIRDLVSGVTHPVILEIGGGFGGLARQLIRAIPGVRYVGVDLPENTVIQSWYLKRSREERRIQFDAMCGDRKEPPEADALLLPNWALAAIQLEHVDVVVNIHSFGEMTIETLGAYFAEIGRLRPDWVFHDNLGSSRRDGFYGIPSTRFPPLDGYHMVASCESRWPRYDYRSTYPCREYLYRFAGGSTQKNLA